MEAERIPVPGARSVSAGLKELSARARAAAEVAGEPRRSRRCGRPLPRGGVRGDPQAAAARHHGAAKPWTARAPARQTSPTCASCSARPAPRPALIYAMHQIKMACIVRHLKGNAALERILRQVAAEQLLLASSTTEGQAGGNVRVQRGRGRARGRSGHARAQGDRHFLCRRCGRHRHHGAPRGRCGGIGPGAAGAAEEATTRSNGCRPGTPSACAARTARASPCARSAPAAADHARAVREESMRRPWCRFAHLLWGSVWAGIAAAATAKAQAFVRNALRQSSGQMPPGAPHFTRPPPRCARCAACSPPRCAATKRRCRTKRRSAALEFQSMITLTKVQVSELAVGDGAQRAARLRLVGLSQRPRIQHRPASARRAVRADHDQQRPHPGESGGDLGDDAAADVDWQLT